MYLNILVSDPLDVPIPDLLVPDLKGLGADAVQDGEEPALESVLEHCCEILQSEMTNSVCFYRWGGCFKLRNSALCDSSAPEEL